MGKVPNVNTKVSAAPVSTAGYTCGATTSKNARVGPAPRLRAVSTALASTDSPRRGRHPGDERRVVERVGDHDRFQREHEVDGREPERAENPVEGPVPAERGDEADGDHDRREHERDDRQRSQGASPGNSKRARR